MRLRDLLGQFGIAFAAAVIFTGVAHAGPIGLTIDPTYDPTLTAAERAAIGSAISNIESNVASPDDITVNIYFTTMSGGLGESNTFFYTVSYFDYYNAYKAVAKSPDQLAALASLGLAPLNESSVNPATGTDEMAITSAEGRNLGFNTPGGNFVGIGSPYDSEISLNTGLTSPPNGLSGNYSLESVAEHEIDEALGIGGTGSTIGDSQFAGDAGDLDLFRYSAPGVRSYSTSSSVTSYFSIDGGVTPLSYFNQIAGADYADWASDPIPNGFGVQVQDAFGSAGTNPTLGVNEETAFNVIGYDLLAPEPSTFMLAALALGFVFALRRRSVNRQEA